MTVPLFDARREFEADRADYVAAAERVLSSGRWILGPEVQGFEAEAAEYLDVRHAVGVASGSDALTLALKTLGVGPGDAVVTTPFTFFATAGAIVNVGAEPVFGDIDPLTLNLDPTCVRRVLERRSVVHDRVGVDPRRIRAIIPVHLFGLPADMDAFEAIREEFEGLSSRTRPRPSGRYIWGVRWEASAISDVSPSSPRRTSVGSAMAGWW